MAKKKKKNTQSEAVTLQKLANQSAKDVQKMINSANKQTLEYNKAEAEKARKYNTQEAATAREFNAAESEKARTWQEEMSNTSHQREVADLKAAGLNPVLSANSGAQSYTTSSANASNASSGAASASLESGASAMSALMGNLMSSLTGLKQTQMSTAAQLRAAELNAAASRYVADSNYAASRYSADQNRAASKYTADNNYNIAMDKPASNPIEFFDKYGYQYRKWLNGVDDNKIYDAYMHVKQAISFSSDPNDFKWKGNFKENSPSNRQLDLALNKLGINHYLLNHMSDKQKSRYREAVYWSFFNPKIDQSSNLKVLNRLLHPNKYDKG